MRITTVNTVYLHCPLKKAFGLGKPPSTISKREFVAVIVRTSEGVTGFGEAGSIGTLRDLGTLVSLVRNLGKTIVGEDPLAVERVWEKMLQHTFGVWPDEAAMGAVAGIDIALWDIIGKVAGQPLHRLLGGYRDAVRCYASGGYYVEGKGVGGLVKEMVSYVDMGFNAVKMKVGRLTPEGDVERVRAVREAVGEDVDIMCDVNKAWSPEEAIRFARLTSKYNIRWLEEPVHWYDYVDGIRMVKGHVDVPIAGGESLHTEHSARDLIEKRAVDIVQVDACAAGGITAWRRIAAMAHLYHLQMAPHHTHIAHMHLVASVPNGLVVEFFPDKEREPLWEALYVKPPIIRKGLMYIPKEPGLGFELNEKTAKKYQAMPA